MRACQPPPRTGSGRAPTERAAARAALWPKFGFGSNRLRQGESAADDMMKRNYPYPGGRRRSVARRTGQRRREPRQPGRTGDPAEDARTRGKARARNAAKDGSAGGSPSARKPPRRPRTTRSLKTSAEPPPPRSISLSSTWTPAFASAVASATA